MRPASTARCKMPPSMLSALRVDSTGAPAAPSVGLPPADDLGREIAQRVGAERRVKCARRTDRCRARGSCRRARRRGSAPTSSRRTRRGSRRPASTATSAPVACGGDLGVVVVGVGLCDQTCAAACRSRRASARPRPCRVVARSSRHHAGRVVNAHRVISFGPGRGRSRAARPLCCCGRHRLYPPIA